MDEAVLPQPVVRRQEEAKGARSPRWGTLILVDSVQGTRGCRGEVSGEVLGLYEDQKLSSHGGLALSTPYQGMDKAWVGAFLVSG